MASAEGGLTAGGPAVTYRVASGGSVVIETLFPGTGHEMVSVYHEDGEDLVMTHYCALGNQPRMRAEGGPEDGRLDFRFTGISNRRSPGELHIHEGWIRVRDRDHVSAEWVSFRGRKREGATRFELVRRTAGPSRDGKEKS
jgi:hypothetical protein